MAVLFSQRFTWHQNCIYNKFVYFIAITILLSVIYRFDFIIKKINIIFPENNRETKNQEAIKPVMKYILLWTNKNAFPFIYFGEKNTIFIHKKCKWTNCYVTDDRYILGDYSIFDVIAFNGPQLQYHANIGDLPIYRSIHQKYVYANIESAANYPVCYKTWNNFFNWTWTYKLNSDAVWGYFTVQNSTHVIGPREHMHWMNAQEMPSIDEEFKKKLQTKTNAVAWFVSNCDTLNKRETYVDNLKYHLNKYYLSIDIYGKCGEMQCPKGIMKRCLKIVKKKYYFYLAFENANSEDYVTEKILNAFNYNTVPIVYGGANYSRFLPPESYINAYDLSPERLAKQIYEIIQNPKEYYIFFKWKMYYSFHLRYERASTDDYCNFCAMINNKYLMDNLSIYKNFDAWWNHSINCNFIK